MGLPSFLIYKKALHVSETLASSELSKQSKSPSQRKREEMQSPLVQAKSLWLQVTGSKLRKNTKDKNHAKLILFPALRTISIHPLMYCSYPPNIPCLESHANALA